MLMSMLIIVGAAFGIVISAFSHPMIYRAVFGGKAQSDDHRRDYP
ncbi:MAG: hypothetical protein AAFR41_08415 [Pseudomonadota bacterium]